MALEPCEPHTWDATGRRCIRCAESVPPANAARNRQARDVRRLLERQHGAGSRLLQGELVMLTEGALRELRALLGDFGALRDSQDLNPPPGA